MAFSLLVDGKPVRVQGRLPLLPLRDVILFPGMALPLFVGRPGSVAAIRRAQEGPSLLFAVAQRRPEVAVPRRSDLYDTGVVVAVRQVLSLPDGTMRVLVEGLARARLLEMSGEDGVHEADVRLFPEGPRAQGRVRELLKEVKAAFLEYARADRRISEDALLAVSAGEDPVGTSYRMAAHLLVRLAARQELLEAPGAVERLHLITRLLESETEIGQLGRKLEDEARAPRGRRGDAPAGGARPAPRALSRDGDDLESELAELEERIGGAHLPRRAEEKARRELERLSRMTQLSPEATVARTYIDWLLALPWGKRSRDRTDVDAAQRLLDEDHFGLAPVKERICEQIAVLRLSRAMRGPVLCLMGPPGVGKTSLGRSVARALNRRFVRMSLGGVRDEAEIRGHRRTYIGAMPGRILQAMRRAGTSNPVILLDEVDKLGLDYRGDPAAALLEVLDPEQNHAFNDHYLEVDYDLSRVLFLTTANSAGGIPPALRDRMEVIRLPGYLETEKLAIAERFLVPKQRAACGLQPGDLAVPRETCLRIVREYTREAGVRGLEREIARICRKAARRQASGDSGGKSQPAGAERVGRGRTGPVERAERAVRLERSDGAERDGRERPVADGSPGGAAVAVAAEPDPRPGLCVGPEVLEEYLGIPRFLREEVVRRNRVGVATGLAWSEAGGSILQIEVSVLPGRGRLMLTGKLGQTMRESAHAALSCVRSRAEAVGLDPQFHRAIDIHVHIPEGEVPKDGPSAGAAIALAMVSALTGIPTRDSVALTGELTLHGQILPIGGLAEKTIAALRAGVRTVLVPDGNERHLAEIPEEVRSGLSLERVETFDQVLRRALVRRPGRLSPAERPSARGKPLPPPSLVLPPAATGSPAARSSRGKTQPDREAGVDAGPRRAAGTAAPCADRRGARRARRVRRAA